MLPSALMSLRRAAPILAMLLASIPPVASAGGFLVSPTLLALPPRAKVASFELANRGQEPVTVQVDAVAWSQHEGDDRYVAADALVISPRRVELLPGQTRLVRLAEQSRTANPGGERAYRVRFRELPPPSTGTGLGVTTLVEQNVPLFFGAAGKPQLAPRLRRTDDGHLLLDIANTGALHARLASQKILRAGSVLSERTTPKYILPGARKQWTLPGNYQVSTGELLEIQLGAEDAKWTLLVE